MFINPIDMEFRNLRYFVAAAEELNFHRAAERLRVAQPAVSAQIKILEEELQVKLFERTTRSMKLTQAGSVLLGKAHELLGAAEQARLLTRRAWDGTVGSLRLGLIPSAASAWLASLLRRYHDLFPGVQLVVSECITSEQLRQLRAGELDAGFLRPPVEFPELEWRFVEEAQQVLAAPPTHRLMKKRHLEWKDFDGERLVMVETNQQHGFYDAFLNACAKAGAHVYPAHFAHDIQIILWMISAGFGIAPTTASLSQIKRPGVGFRSLPPGLPPVRTVLAWRRDNNSSVLMNFLKCFTEYQNAGRIVRASGEKLFR